MLETVALIELLKVKVASANAEPGPLSWGFPPPSAFLGFTHALERRHGNLSLGGTAIICNEFNPQTGGGGYSLNFALMRHPYKASWRQKTFDQKKSSAIVEEGRVHLTVTLVVEVLGSRDLNEDELETLRQEVWETASGMRIAGGSVSGKSSRIHVIDWSQDDEESTREKVRRERYKWMPGFALVERQDILRHHLAELRKAAPDTDDLEGLLDLLALHCHPAPVEEAGRPESVLQGSDRTTASKVEWVAERRQPGWLVPLPVGYGALSKPYEAGSVLNARDASVPFRFVEALYGVGQWLSPHRVETLEQILWRMDADPDEGVYVCRNNYTSNSE